MAATGHVVSPHARTRSARGRVTISLSRLLNSAVASLNPYWMYLTDSFNIKTRLIYLFEDGENAGKQSVNALVEILIPRYQKQ